MHVRGLIERLLGKPGIAVNNNAAAVYLVLNELAAGSEVIVSRGELIEIGEGFRIPDIMTRSGAILREVGTTNRTTIDDYARAINENTALLMAVHHSNFRITGFTAKPALRDLAALAHEHRLPLYEDLGSGCIADLRPFGITEPLVSESLATGVDLVSFSGDKLLGGPQAGLIAGDEDLVGRIRKNPMFRAFRLDKLIYQALEATLRSLLFERWDEVPALRMIRMPAEEIRRRAEELIAKLPAASAELAPGESVIGGGATPEQVHRHLADRAPLAASEQGGAPTASRRSAGRGEDRRGPPSAGPAHRPAGGGRRPRGRRQPRARDLTRARGGATT